MLYYLSRFREHWGPLNVFQYISFRSGAAALTALGLSLILGPALIEALRRRKVGQIQRSDGPASHLSKQGTPTMGGLLIFIAVLASVSLWMRPDVRFTWIMELVTVALTAVGFWDDYLKLVRKDPRGASSRVKFAAQISTAFVVITYLAVRPPNPAFVTQLNIPYLKDRYLDLGSLYYVFAVLVIVGSSNAVNLTDGLDGLAAGSIIFCAITYGVFAYAAGNVIFAGYLRIVHVPGAGELMVYSSALVGACLGFLWFNAYPAEVFMGDTSSLFLGGAIGTIALCVKQELLLPFVGGVFVVEAFSVMIQVASFKLTGKRVFKMAPIHHHFELMGWKESKVIIRFWIAALIFALFSLSTLKLR